MWFLSVQTNGGLHRERELTRLRLVEMSDALYLSLWYPNLRLAGLADKLVAVLGEFAKHGGEPLVYSATVWPVSWSESPVFQQVYGRRVGPNQPKDQIGAAPRKAVAEALDSCMTITRTSSRSGGIWGIGNGGWPGQER